MKTTRTTAFAVVALGIVLLVAGPLLPGGERLTRHDPPQLGHVTDLAMADDGSVLAGTQDGELWRMQSERWTKVDVELGGQPVTALAADLSGDPARGPIGTAGGLVNAPTGLPPVSVRISDETPTAKGLLLGTGEGLLLQSGDTWERLIPDINVYRLEQDTHGGESFVHVGSVASGVLSARVDALQDWQPNSEGLHPQANVFTFSHTGAGRLLAGTDKGVYWQDAPMQPWRQLEIGLENSRILSLHLSSAGADAGDAEQHLWIGSDDGLYRVALLENETGVEAASYADLLAPTTESRSFGISWIVPADGGVMFSAGGVFRYGHNGLPGWYWISLAGVVFILLGGWLLPARESEQAAPSRA
ncbi:MAG: ABC transporter substrate-binding protein [Thiohalocapsa sp.]|nr:ABC transporter substrate-binding protein [Thiohalocapsa sp.]MCF7988999.1 ABC transporter substrate-binding protein [Thiohalocapsa sp.]